MYPGMEVDPDEVRKAMPRVWISDTIANELIGRDVCKFAWPGGTIYLTLEQAQELYKDAEFNADAQSGPEIMSAGVRRAYAALEAKLRTALEAFEPYQPPAFAQTEHPLGEPKYYSTELRPEDYPKRSKRACFGSSDRERSLWKIVPDEPEVFSRAAVERQAQKFNDTIGLFAALRMWEAP